MVTKIDVKNAVGNYTGLAKKKKNIMEDSREYLYAAEGCGTCYCTVFSRHDTVATPMKAQ